MQYFNQLLGHKSTKWYTPTFCYCNVCFYITNPIRETYESLLFETAPPPFSYIAVKGDLFMLLELMSRSFILVLKLSSVEINPQKWDKHVQFGTKSKFQNTIKKVKTFFKIDPTPYSLTWIYFCENCATSVNIQASTLFHAS